MSIRSILLMVTTLLLVTHCGKKGNLSPPDMHSDTNTKSVTLLLWGAFWCPNCSKDIPEIQKRLKNLNIEGSYNLILYVPTGYNQLSKPTEEITKEYKEKIAFEGDALPDPWFWVTYKKYFPNHTEQVPAAVLLDENNNVIQLFPSGATTFVIEDIIGAILGALR